jgi:hypothetical protein
VPYCAVLCCKANVALICFFNYYYTFLQLDPKDLSDQLKRQVRAPRGAPLTPHLRAKKIIIFYFF